MKNSKLQFLTLTIIAFLGIIVTIGLIVFYQKKEDLKESEYGNETTSIKTMCHVFMSDGNNDIDRMIKDILLDEDLTITGSSYDNMFGANWEPPRWNDNLPKDIKYNDVLFFRRPHYADNQYVGEQLSVDADLGVELYSIKYVSSDLAIAIKDTSTDKYYIYLTEEYKPETFKQFMTETGFFDMVDVVNVIMSSKDVSDRALRYYDGFVEYFSNQIEKMTEKEFYLNENPEGKRTGLKLLYYMPNLKSDVEIIFLEKGEIRINISDTLITLYFSDGDKGIKLATDLMEYIIENGKGYEY